MVSRGQGSPRRAMTAPATRWASLWTRQAANIFIFSRPAPSDRRSQSPAGRRPLVFFDGTVSRVDELIAAGLGNKTGQAMGHIAMSGERGAIASLGGLDIGPKIFLRLNNSNPALLTVRTRHDSGTCGLANPRRRNGDHALNVGGRPLRMTALSLGEAYRSIAPRNWKRRCVTLGLRAITVCIRFIGCCTAAS